MTPIQPIPITNLIAIIVGFAAFSVFVWAVFREKTEPRNDPPPFYGDLLAKERYRAQAAWGETFKAREENGRLGIRIHNQRKRIAELMRQLTPPTLEDPPVEPALPKKEGAVG